MTSRILVATLVALLGACSVGDGGGEGDDDGRGSGSGPGSADPSQSFEAEVKPNVGLCLACHGGNLPPNLLSYAKLEAKYKVKPGDTNILVTKGSHEGRALTDAQRAAIIAWINRLP